MSPLLTMEGLPMGKTSQNLESWITKEKLNPWSETQPTVKTLFLVDEAQLSLVFPGLVWMGKQEELDEKKADSKKTFLFVSARQQSHNVCDDR